MAGIKETELVEPEIEPQIFQLLGNLAYIKATTMTHIFSFSPGEAQQQFHADCWIPRETRDRERQFVKLVNRKEEEEEERMIIS